MTWWTPPVAVGRIAALRIASAIFVVADLWWITPWVRHHAEVPTELYRPVAVARALHVPAATPAWMTFLTVAMVLAAVVIGCATVAAHRAGAGIAVRLAGSVLALAYGWWMVLAMSYGKVDHDRFAFLVLLAVLPTVRAAGWGESAPSESAGWAVRMVQVGVVATYFLAAIAKVRFGGWNWATGATFSRAVIRRGTSLVDWTVDVPWLLQAGQWSMLVLEFAAPVLLVVSARRQTRLVIALYGFHTITYLSLGIAFFPHLVALAAFLPLERVARAGHRRALSSSTPSGAVSA